MTWPPTYHLIRRLFWRYMIALGLVGTGFLLCLIIPEVMLPRPFLAFWPVVVLAAEFGGKGPGALAAVASALCVEFIIYPYYGGMNLHEWVGMTAMGIFLAGGLAISVFIGEKLKIQSLQRLQAAAVAASEARYRSLFEATNVGKSVTLPTGEIQVNRAFCDMLGYDPEDMHGKTWQELTPPEEIDPINERLAPLLRGEKDAARFEKRYIHKNGSSVWTDVSVVVQRDGEGKPLHFISTVVDMTEHKCAERNLIESERRYRALFENMPVGFVVFEVVQDEKGGPVDLVILAANQIFSATTGFKIQEVIGKRLTQVIPGIENDAADWIGTYGKVALTGETRQFELSSERLGYYYSVTAYQSGLKKCAVTFLDITARKCVEAEARRERDFANGVLNSLPGVLYCYDENFRFLRWNKNFEQVTGYTSEEVARQSPLDYFAELDKGLVAARIQEAFEKGESSVEADFVSKDGTRTPYFFTGLATTIEDRRYLVGVGVDVSAHKQAEATLRESERRFRTLFEQAAVGVAEIETATGRFIRINQCYCDIVGYTREEMFALEVQTIIHPDDLQADLDNKRRLVAGEIQEFTMDKRYFRKDRSIVWVSLTVSPMWSPGATPDHHIAIVEDISARKQAENALQQLNLKLEQRVEQRTQELTVANTRLQELDRLKSLFIASMSHELRTPLNSIIGFTGIILLGMSGEINAEQRKQLGIVKNNASHLLELINDIIDVSKIESGAIELADETFDLPALVRETRQMLVTAATEKNITLSLQVVSELSIRSDRRRLKQILINLLDNAIKFTDAGEVAIELGLHESWIMLSVHDSGIGIDQHQQNRLFQAFSQIAPPSGRAHQGTGLGLYLSQRLAHLMGGDITLTSAAGVGSCFTLTLPYRRNT